MVLSYLSHKDAIIVTGISSDLHSVEKTLSILKIDVIIIAGANLRFIVNCYNTIVKLKPYKRTIILSAQNKPVVFKKGGASIQIISFDQKLESLYYIISNDLNREEKALKLAQKETKTFLSDREKEILNLIYKGKRTKEIAEELFISTFTVENHRNNILKKTKFKNMLTLINHLNRNGFFNSTI